MVERGGVTHTCFLLQQAAVVGEATSNGEEEKAGLTNASRLPESLVEELYSIFNRPSKNSALPGRAKEWAGSYASGSKEHCQLDGKLWEECAKNRLSLQAVVAGLRKEMEANVQSGIKCAGIYVGMLAAPACPLYSIFCPLTFQSLLRCIRNSCRQPGASDKRGSSVDKLSGPAKRSKTKKVKKATPKSKQIHTPSDTPKSASQEFEATNVQEVFSIVSNLQATLQILALKEHQECLKALVQLLVDLPLEILKLHTDNKQAMEAPEASMKHFLSLSFSMLQILLTSVHGDVTASEVLVYKALAPTIVLSHSEVSLVQQVEMKKAALHFLQQQMQRQTSRSTSDAVIGLAHYLCHKAPERGDSRQNAVVAVLEILQALTYRDWCHFSTFLTSFSQSKASCRLFAVDLSLALLLGLPSPFVAHKSADARDQDYWTTGSHVEGEGGQFSTTVPGSSEGATDSAQLKRGYKGNIKDKGDTERESKGWGSMCLKIILARCSDKAPAVRARSISNLAQALDRLPADSRHHSHLKRLLGWGAEPKEPQAEIESSRGPTPVPSTPVSGRLPKEPSKCQRDLELLMLQRCLDDKASVRKAAVVLMHKSTVSLRRPPTGNIVAAMGAACGDALVSIRKAGLTAISEVVRSYPSDSKASLEWLQSALPLALDNEVALQEECLDHFQELVINRVAMFLSQNLPGSNAKSGQPFTAKQNSKEAQNTAEKDLARRRSTGSLALLKELAIGATVSSTVKRACGSLGRQGRLSPQVAIALQDLISALERHSSERQNPNYFIPAEVLHGAWFLLSEVSAFVPKSIGWTFLKTHWQALEITERWCEEHPHPDHPAQKHNISSGHGSEPATWAAGHLLRTIANVAPELPCEAAADLAGKSLERLKSFSMHTTEVWAHVELLTTLSRQKTVSVAEGEQLVKIWVSQLLDEAEVILQTCASKSESKWVQQQPGSCSRSTPSATPSSKGEKGRHLSGSWNGNPLKTVSDSKKKEDTAAGRAVPASADFMEKILTAIFTGGALAIVCPTAKTGPLVTILQVLVTPRTFLASMRSGQRNSDAGQLLPGEVSPEVIAQAWVALTKLCLADERLAKKFTPLFIQELDRTESAAVRNNLVQAMTDFFVRYPPLMDGYMHKLAKVLSDSCELVRRQAVILFARLLQKDYVKWRGALFHQFLLALVDDSPSICELANFLFKSILKTKAPLVAYNSFVEVMFILNDCRLHPSFSTALSSEWKHGQRENMEDKRMYIYKALLQLMAPEHLLATAAKLCAEILAGAADGVLDLNNSNAETVLQDALRILASKELRVVGNRVTTGSGDNEEEEGGGAVAAAVAAKGRLVTRLMKKNLVQNAIPILIDLKRRLEAKNSPLLGLLMESMRVLLKEYKNELEEFLVADKQLHKELLYDIQKHESNKARTKVAAAMAAGGTPPISIAASGLLGSVGKARCRSTSVRKTQQAYEGPLPAAATPGSSSFQGSRFKATPQANYVANFPGRGIDKKKGSSTRAATSKDSRVPLAARDLNAGVLAFRTRLPPGDSKKRKAGHHGHIPSPRVMWLDQALGSSCDTPGKHPQMMKLPIPNEQTPKGRSTLGVQLTSPSANTSAQNPSSMPPSDGFAGAVADVAAQAAVVAALREAACGSGTPLRVMSIPRLRPTIPKTHTQFLAEGTPAMVVPSSLAAGLERDVVRRRQSFSSVSLVPPS